MDVIKQQNYNIFLECLNLKENNIKLFKEEFKETDEYWMYITSVINELSIPLCVTLDKEVIYENIIEWAFHACLSIHYSKTEDELYARFRESIEDGFRSRGITGVITATIGTWAASIFLGYYLDIDYLKACSIEAAWTRYNEEIVEYNWKRVGSHMGKYIKECFV